MFTGIVQARGTVVGSTPTPAGIRLAVRPREWSHQPRPGESISVSGCCLTLAAPPGPDGLVFDVVPETLSKTTLGRLARGSQVNLEHSLRASDLIDGHIVQGHVDGVAAVERVQSGADWRLWLRPPADLMQYMAPKGSVAVDGVSLTLAAVDPARGFIEIALIPTTLERTTLGALTAGDRVNVEADVIMKMIVHRLAVRG